MKQRGFTLIELLAVIVILAIIALIAVPVILNVINKSKESSAVDSAYGYIHAIENNLAIAEVKNGLVAEDKEYDDLREFEETYNISIKGTKPVSGKFTLNKRKVVSAEFKIDGYNIVCDKKKCESRGKGVKVTVTYNANGGTLDKTEDSVTPNSTLDLPTPTKNDYVFLGWFTEENGGEEVTNETPITSEITLYAHYVKTINNFDYTGSVQEITLPAGRYKLEVWGAQGGYITAGYGGYGGYSYGEINVTNEQKLYVVVGQKGSSQNNNSTTLPESYNGGGAAGPNNNSSGLGAGGGATHIATRTGLLSTLESYKSDILIVAGGGGGQGGGWSVNQTGGHGGGYYGVDGQCSGESNAPKGGRQSYFNNCTTCGGGSAPTSCSGFGYGANGTTGGANGYTGGGGGGWYGGGSGYVGGGGGGSGYIGNTLLTNKGMYCYSCSTSSDELTKTYSTTSTGHAISNYANTDNGYARITYLGK